MKSRCFIRLSFVFVMISLFFAGDARAELKVYDANGQYLGILWDKDPVSILLSSGKIVTLDKYWTVGLQAEYKNIDFWYDSTDCTGTPYYFPGLALSNPDGTTMNVMPLLDTIFRHYCDYKVYSINYNAPREVVPNSKKYFNTSTNQCECYQVMDIPAMGITVTAYPFVEENISFQGPLKFVPTTFDVNCDGQRGLPESIYILQEVSGVRESK
ncbi:MAG: hypothetical protein R2941_06560 [Desulfobacterales bacterium]